MAWGAGQGCVRGHSMWRAALRGGSVACTSSLSARYALPVAAAVREVSDDTDEDEGAPSQREVALGGEVSSTWLGLGLGLPAP